MTVAIAIFNGEGDDTIKELQEELAHLDTPATPAENDVLNPSIPSLLTPSAKETFLRGRRS